MSKGPKEFSTNQWYTGNSFLSYIISEIKQRPSGEKKRNPFFASASSTVNGNSITFDRGIKQLMT